MSPGLRLVQGPSSLHGQDPGGLCLSRPSEPLVGQWWGLSQFLVSELAGVFSQALLAQFKSFIYLFIKTCEVKILKSHSLTTQHNHS